MRLIGPNVDPLSGTVQLLAQRPEASYSFLPILREQCRTVRAPRSGRTDRRQTQQDWPSTMTHCCQFFGPRFRSSTSTHPRLNPVFVVAHLPASNLFTSTRRWSTCRLVGRDGPCGPSVHGTSTYRAVDEGPMAARVSIRQELARGTGHLEVKPARESRLDGKARAAQANGQPQVADRHRPNLGAHACRNPVAGEHTPNRCVGTGLSLAREHLSRVRPGRAIRGG